ncbi:UDP-N-acetylglucosamine 4-epimerase [Marinilabilia salmonicolor]|jgi:UDP-N-acetylglucosamine 4-epimerase|uniref:SDR family oxidoreductase n=1 Tax=Marinilabilia salmonicolor TaxID=989 RepID=UPI000D078154|nr:SDR family oxidoreductase [Marinilabilia salmonicolor]PRY98318.1 UDP-N-acetylglucosamine 4-epimerase [Marinilabilia salmonicolor]
MREIRQKKVLVTGGAGFIGSNIIEKLLQQENQVTCLDNFSTGKPENIAPFKENSAFTLLEGDIRNLEDCRKAVEGVEIVLHEAALGSVPRSINDPITSNDVNVGGFLNMLVAARDAGVKRFVYAASSSTYGDSEVMPKVEDKIGKPLSPYAITKYVDELYADVFGKLYGMELIGLRYFNVFGPRQDPNGAYAAVIPKFVSALIDGKSPVINGDGTFSRDFTFVANVVQANELAALVEAPEAVNTVYNVACGERTSLNELIGHLKNLLAEYDGKIADVSIHYGPERAGDVPHSLASVKKAKTLLGYEPLFKVGDGLKEAIHWYWENLSGKK